jgi:hypothetical protein
MFNHFFRVANEIEAELSAFVFHYIGEIDGKALFAAVEAGLLSGGIEGIAPAVEAAADKIDPVNPAIVKLAVSFIVSRASKHLPS